MPNYWIFLSDPDDYHLDEVFKKKKEMWDGVKSPVAQNYLKSVQKGDRIIGYHTAPEKSVYAELEAASDSYQNPEAKGKNVVVDVSGVRKFAREVPLAELKANNKLKGMKLFQLFRPIGVTPLTAEEYKEIVRLGGGS